MRIQLAAHLLHPDFFDSSPRSLYPRGPVRPSSQASATLARIFGPGASRIGFEQGSGVILCIAMPRNALGIGIVFETFETYPVCDMDAADAQAEYEPESTIELLEEAISLLGHEPRRIGSPFDLLAGLSGGPLDLDAALNLAEGYGSRNREAWAPVLLEMAQIPTLGSDALTLSLSLDKAWTNRAVAAVGVPIAPQCVVADADAARKLDLKQAGLEFPLFVKPRWEGSAKGIRASSRVSDRASLVREIGRVSRDYAQPALVEAFLPGAEYTLAVVGNDPPRVLPVLQRALEQQTRIGAHALAGTGSGSADEPAYCLPGTLTEALEAELQRLALLVWRSLECRDFARLDFRLDSDDRPVFLEINPLPTFAVDGTFAIQAELAGRSVADFLAEILSQGLRRLGLPERASGLPRAVSR